jgi:hypothetical protein
VSYGEVIAIVDALKTQPGNLIHAAVEGWDWPATFGEIATIMLAESTLNWRRDVKRQAEPIRLPRPWPDETAVDPDLRRELTEQLARRSVFRNRL